MTFPFSGEFKFKLLKSPERRRHDSFNYKRFERRYLHLNTLALLFVFFVQEMPGNSFVFCFAFPSREKCPEKTLLHARERAEENDPPKCGQISEIFEQRKPKILLQK